MQRQIHWLRDREAGAATETVTSTVRGRVTYRGRYRYRDIDGDIYREIDREK